ncbi:hypothetical protein [Burkholderia thailandensis]|uniref:hypothetical protein n=1 Tax=Burkholderia thailandensis TaxID=57975 RepID=UPI0005B74600|nr:hypothetical protein [Burkholderia thailandensis]AVR10283.1 hypothetical protein A8H31_23715 [Burkholderia thailandensis]KIS58093.1 hypothetical protein BTP_2378 [Burkholderia thailandensis Phuket 4W-1]
MRDYSRVSPKFWIGDTGKKLKKAGAEAVVVGLYLMTSPHSNMLGLFYQPELLIAHETGLGIEGASKGLQRCIEAGFCAYDRESEMVWVFEMARFQIAEKLSESDKRSIGVQNEYNQLPENPFLAAFYDRYEKAFNLTRKRESKVFEPSPSEAPSEPHRSQEQEQEQEQEQKQEKNPLSTSSTAREIEQIFAYWQKRMDSPRSNLDDKRRKAIRGALGMGYSPAELCKAIRGCSLTPHNMGQNDRGQKYNGVELIFRSADQIDRFIANDVQQPRANGHANVVQAHNEAVMAAFLAGDAPQQSDPMTIDMEH